MTPKDALDRYLVAQQDRFLAELRELCAIPSEASNPAALGAAATWCLQRLEAAGCTSREIRADGIPTLVVGEVGQGKRTLIGVQHYDVQPAVPLELWQSPPYAPALRDGALYARGVEDNKGHLLLRIQAVEAHRAVFGELPIRMRFLIEGEEEAGSMNLETLLAQDPGLLEADGALKEGGTLDAAGRPQLSLGNKGILYVELRVRTMSSDAHSGGATHLPNAPWRLLRALATLQDERGRVLIAGFYDQVRPVSPEVRAHVDRLPFEAAAIRRVYGIERFAFGLEDAGANAASVFEPTCNICGVWSGYIEPGTKTVIPAEAAAKLDFRLVPDQDPQTIADQLRAHLDAHGFADVEVHYDEGEHPYRGAMDAPLVRAAQAVAEEAFGKPAVILPNSGGTAPMWVVSHRHRLANVTLGMGHQGSRVHAPNEHIRLDNYWRALRATARLYQVYATQA
jgi:acetylornithine deacetylase/succinyl-diaminopimelate desuccinylase-like protein